MQGQDPARLALRGARAADFTEKRHSAYSTCGMPVARWMVNLRVPPPVRESLTVMLGVEDRQAPDRAAGRQQRCRQKEPGSHREPSLRY